jgi:RHS repeat-associated protein
MNESNNYVQFDDFKVTYTKSNVLQYNEYYPFGLQTSNSWTREDASNRYLYNGGNELNENSGWYETFFREYDAALGRFMQMDPLAGSFASHSPYHYAYNNPMLFNDLFGAESDTTNHSGSGIPYNHSIVSQRIGPHSANHWAGGATQYSDWSASGGSETYRQTHAAGAIQLGNTQYFVNGNGELTAYEERHGQRGSWEMIVTLTPDPQSSNGFAIDTKMVFAQQGGDDPFDVSGIAVREPYGFWESFFFGTIEDGVLYNRDGTPLMKGVVSGTPPSWVGGPAGGLRTAGKGLQLLVQQRGVWRHAINGRVGIKGNVEGCWVA